MGNVRELRATSHSDRKSDKVDAEKIAGMHGLIRRSSGPSPTERWPHTFTLIRARDVLVRLRTSAVNSCARVG